MKQAFIVGVSVMAGILIGRVQIIENHDANDAIREADRADKRAHEARREVIRTRAILDSTEKQVIGMWRQLDPMLDDFLRADSVVDREAARQRIEHLRWSMETVDAKITAARELGGSDERTAMRQAFVKQNFGGQ